MSLNFINGDATNPQSDGIKVIVHICNDVGAWGRGFVNAVSKRWKGPEAMFRHWFYAKSNVDLALPGDPYELGSCQYIKVEDNIWVINMVAQHGILLHPPEPPPIRLDALEKCLEKVMLFSTSMRASVHMPRIGCGLAGGNWDNIEPIIKRQLIDKGVDVFVYDYDGPDKV